MFTRKIVARVLLVPSSFSSSMLDCATGFKSYLFVGISNNNTSISFKP